MKYLIYIACLIAGVALGGTGFNLSSGSISAPIDATNTITFFGDNGNGWSHYANVSGTKYLDGVATSWTDEFYTVTGGTNIEFNANSIADPRIYNRALSADEIRELASMSMGATNLGTRPYDPLYGDQYVVTDGSEIYTGDDRADGVPRDGLIAEYLFANDACDTSGNGYDGAALNGATIASGYAEFDGVDDFILIDGVDALNFDTGNYTICFWWNLNIDLNDVSLPTTDEFIILNARDNEITERWLIKADTTADQLQFATFTGGAEGTIADILNGGSQSWDANKWYFTTLTYDGTNYTFDVDNVYYNSTTATTPPGTSSTPFLTVGGNYGKNVSLTSQNFDGEIDTIRFYDRALSTEEKTSLYQEGLATKSSLLLSTKVQAPIGEQLTNSDITDYMGNSISVSGTVTATASPIKGRVDGSGNWIQDAFEE